MKRNILLGFLLIGLVVMEWGCGEPEVCLGFRYYLENVEDVDFYKFGQDSTLEEYNNESNFNVVVYKVNLNSTSDSSGGSCSEGGSLFENFVNLQVLDGAKDVTEYFGTGKYARYDNKYYFYPVDTSVNRNYHISENRPPYSIFFKQMKPFDSVDTLSLTFRIYNQRYSFETTTDPIIITP